MTYRPLEINEEIAFVRGMNSNKHICYLLGYGKYLGKYIPTKDEINNIKRKDKKSLAFRIKEACKFLLKDGNIYWEWDGYFINKNRFKELFIDDIYKEGWKIIYVDKNGRWRKNNRK